MSLTRYSDRELLDELARRQRRIDLKIEFCESCSRFTPWTSSRAMPESYNPCTLAHKMHFRAPDEYNWTGDDWGFFRLHCADRSVNEAENKDGGAVYG